MTITKMILIPMVAATALFTSAAFAGENRGEGVLERARPDYDPAGARVGSFLLFPSVEFGVGYDDNIGRANTGETDSYTLTVRPELNLQSQWSRHELNVGIMANTIFHEADSDLDYTDVVTGMEGRLDISSSTNIEATASYSDVNEELRTATAPTAASEPTEYTTWDVGLQLNQRFNRLTAELEGTYGEIDYDDVRAIGGGIIDNDARDRSTAEARVRVGYDVDPDVNIFVEGALNEVDYDQEPPTVAVSRDSDGYRIGAGASFDITKLMTGEIVVGYFEQDYDSAALTDVDGLAADADVSWFVTPLTTLNFGAGSEVLQSDTTGSGGYIAQYVEAGVDHELLRNVIVSAGASFENNDYEGIVRNEDIIGLDLEAQYLINRNMSLKAGYSFETRDSDVAGRDYDRNQIGLTLRLQL
jgi:hypothetical protein